MSRITQGVESSGKGVQQEVVRFTTAGSGAPTGIIATGGMVASGVHTATGKYTFTFVDTFNGFFGGMGGFYEATAVIGFVQVGVWDAAAKTLTVFTLNAAGAAADFTGPEVCLFLAFKNTSSPDGSGI